MVMIECSVTVARCIARYGNATCFYTTKDTSSRMSAMQRQGKIVLTSSTCHLLVGGLLRTSSVEVYYNSTTIVMSISTISIQELPCVSYSTNVL
jgi:hypothetical protein